MGHERLDLVLVGEIARQDMGAIPEFAAEPIEHLPPRAGQRHGGALLVKGAGNRLADPAGRPGDEGSLASQIEHRSLLDVTPRRA